MFKYTVDRDLDLRLLDYVHAEELFKLTDDNREYLRKWLPWLDSVSKVEDSRYFIEISKKQFADGLGFQAGIWYGGHLAGVIGHLSLSVTNKSVGLGYWLGEKYQGRGIMTRACEAMIEYAYSGMGLHRVKIRCAQKNLRSRAIPERLGFVQEGIIREAGWLYDHFEDDLVYGLLAPEWHK